MKIRKIEYENFRNFKEHGEIICSTDGKVTIIYGKNGEGKTTLHQLFQWVFYGQVHFNKTTTERLYNLAFEGEQPHHAVFQVMGRVDFEHIGTKYSLTRTYTYRKELDTSAKIGEELELNILDEDDNWKRIDRPQETIEKLLPSGLAEYFFFDGENMIADLRVKGRDSAKSLRKALYSIFDLDILESALTHIGSTDLKTTVLGKLYLSKGSVKSGSNVNVVKTNIDNAQNKISQFRDKKESDEEEREKKKQLISEISEQIGATKSKEDYERERKELIRQRDIFLAHVITDEKQFGDKVVSSFPQLLISKTVEDARNKIHLKVQDSKVPIGLEKRLIFYLLESSTRKCICGTELCEKQREHIRNYLSLMPPANYANLYSDFSRTAKQWGEGYNREELESCIKRTLEDKEQSEQCDIKIKELDENKKNSKDIEDLIVERGRAEERVKELDENIAKETSELEKYEIYLKRQMKEFDNLTATIKTNEVVMRRIRIIEEVKEYFKQRMEEEASKYSKLLQENIQDLLNKMLTSKRTVTVSPEFSVKIMDSYKDESKSEGQFAVVSFAYIGAILKLVMCEKELSGKEYPLVLDGPFSKLDPEQRQNVIENIPEFASQVILFSKDNLQEYFSAGVIGRTYTIKSNDERNIAYVKEGYLWN